MLPPKDGFRGEERKHDILPSCSIIAAKRHKERWTKTCWPFERKIKRQGCFDLHVTTFHHGLMGGTVSAVLVVAKPAAEPTRALRCIHNVFINLHYTTATSLPMEWFFPALPDGSGASKTHLHGYEVYAKLLLTPSFNPVSRGNLGILPNVALNFNLGSC